MLFHYGITYFDDKFQSRFSEEIVLPYLLRTDLKRRLCVGFYSMSFRCGCGSPCINFDVIYNLRRLHSVIWRQVEEVIVYDNRNAMARSDCSMDAKRDKWWQDVIENQSSSCNVEWVEAEHPLFLLYTSGSTGHYVLESRKCG